MTSPRRHNQGALLSNGMRRGLSALALADRGVLISARTNTTVTGTADGYQIVKSAGGGAYSGDAVSALIAGDFLLRVQHIGAAATNGLYGMSSTPEADTAFAGMEVSLAFASGRVYVYHSGVAAVSEVTADKTAYIRRVGSTVTVETSDGTPIPAAGRTIADPLGFDCALYELNETIEVRLEA